MPIRIPSTASRIVGGRMSAEHIRRIKRRRRNPRILVVVLIVLLAFAAVAGGVRFLGVESEE